MLRRLLLPLVPLLALLACDGGAGTGPQTVASVSILPDSAVVPIGGATQLSATALDARGQAVAGVAVSWESSDTSIVRVSSEGLVNGRAGGAATVTATAAGRSDTARVRVAFPPGLRVVSGGDATDTIEAPQAQPLVVSVYDAVGAPASGAEVRFEAVSAPAPAGCAQSTQGSACSPGPGVAVQDSAFQTFGATATSRVDARGRATVRLRMGRTAGLAKVMFTVPALGFRDSALYTVTVGTATRVLALPRDTAVYVGGSYRLRTAVLDRFGNARNDAVRLEAATVNVTASDGAVHGVAVGRGEVTARLLSMTDRVQVSVVPAGTIAVSAPDANASLAVLNLDGSGYARFDGPASGPFQCCGTLPAWSPDGQQLAYQQGTSSFPSSARLYLASPSGSARKLIQTSYGAASEKSPRFSRDGSWIYYTAAVGNDGSLWRTRPDGSGTEQLRPSGDSFGYEGMPSPSPDGSRLAFVARGSVNLSGIYTLVIRTLDLRTRAVSALNVSGLSPEWSPSGDLIAYIAGQGSFGRLTVMRPDGSGQRAITSVDSRYYPDFDWSPDGRYIIARSDHSRLLELVDVSTGIAVPLPFSALMNTPAWKPVP